MESPDDPHRSQPGQSAPPPPADPRIGTILSGWRIDSLLGKSRIARVYSAATQVGERVAIKVMEPNFRGDDRIRRRLFREANLARRDLHPAIATVHTADVTTNGEAYVVMERLFGRDVGAILRHYETRLSALDALLIADAALEVIADCHNRDLILRNLAPFNLYIDTQGTFRVYDLGSALISGDSIDQTLQALGTDLHGYLAPELLASARALGDVRSDLWSMGAILLSLTTGRAIGDSQGAATWIDEPPPSLRPGELPYDSLPVDPARLRPDIPGPVARIILRAIASDPAQRYPDVPAMRADIAHVLDALAPGFSGNSTLRQQRLQHLVRPMLSEEELEDAGRSASWSSIDRLRELFRLVENTLYTARRSGWEDEETRARLDALVSKLLQVTGETPEGFRWEVRPAAFTLEGEALWLPDTPNDQIPYNLFVAGFREIRILSGINAAECEALLRWMILDPERELAGEDDHAIAFWRLGLQHVQTRLVSSVILQDVEEYERLGHELAAIQSPDARRLLERLQGQMQGIASMGQHEASGEPLVPAFALQAAHIPDTQKRAFEQALQAAIPRWRARLAALLHQLLARMSIASLREPLFEGWDKFVADCFFEDRPEDALDIFGLLAEAGVERPVLEKLAPPFFEDLRFQNILDRAAPRKGGALPAETTLFLRARLAQLLEWMPGENFEVLLAASLRVNDRGLLTLFLDRISAHSQSNELLLAETIRTAPPLVATLLIARFAERLTPERARIIEAAISSPYVRVEIEAVEVLARYSPQRAIRPLRKLLRHDDAPIRLRAMDAIARNKIPEAAEELLSWLEEARFHTLPVTERRQAMSAALEAAPDKAEARLAALVAKHGLVADAELDSSRLLAIETLRDEGLSDQALEAVRAAGKRRWWNTAELQEAARQAEAVIMERLAQIDQAIVGQQGQDGED